VLFDQRRLVTGSYNWTLGAARSNWENLVLLDDERCVAPFRDEFERLWQLFAHEE
jgi:phosphatidylserine/phosphatidylglycerophosphate/cardiolipin synthase-like enzyme